LNILQKIEKKWNKLLIIMSTSGMVVYAQFRV
jgi:hypothetical protein